MNQYHLPQAPAYVGVTGTFDDATRRDETIIKWSGKTLVPEIGTRILVTMNGLGHGTVTAYFVEEGWLGVYVSLEAPPAWWVKQNAKYPGRHSMIFGTELRTL